MQGMMRRRSSGSSSITQYDCVHCICHGCSESGNRKPWSSGLNPGDQGFLLPLSEHPWHMQCTQSYCVILELPDDRRLIIPCIELIRFYCGSSSSLVTALFLPPLERKTLFSNPRLDQATGRLVLELGEKMSGASAADIGRLHLDPVAWRAAMHIDRKSTRLNSSHLVISYAVFCL